VTVRILLDSDLGSDVDDALALGVVLAEPEALELVAVTTVAGDPAARAAATARLLGLAGRTGVEVCAGASDPLVRRDRFVWRDIETEGYPEGPDAVLSPEPAAERIVRAAREVPELELVAIGPLTNLAHALALDPKLPRRVAGLTVMGGHVREVRIGELVCEPGIDYNLCSDPEASVAVLGAGFRTTLVTADVTLQTWMRREQLARLDAGGPLPRALAEQVRVWEPAQRRLFTGLGGTVDPENVAYLHDPLTVWSLVDPSPLHFELLHIVPTIQEGVLRTLEASPAAPLGTEMRVATRVDARAAADAIVERIARL